MKSFRFPAGLVLPVVLLFVLSACSGSTDSDAGSPSNGAESTEDAIESGDSSTADGSDARSTLTVMRPDIDPSGNRVIAGSGALLSTEPVVVDLDEQPAWVVAVLEGDTAKTLAWAVEYESGRQVIVDSLGNIYRDDVSFELFRLASTEFESALPDGRLVTFEEWQAGLVQPTDRYPHGVLGDELEASSLAVQSTNTGFGVDASVEDDDGSVIEGIAPILADLTGDGKPEILVTISNGEVGARLGVFDTDLGLIAESDPIGKGRRWRNQLAVAPIGPDGEIEVIDIFTPHIGGPMEFFRLEGDRLNLVASQTGFTSHAIGSRNLDMAIVADADGDGSLDVVAPTNDRTELGIVTRTDDGTEVVGTVELPGRLTTNIGVRSVDDRLQFAVGTENNQLLIWP